mmetsp:Transcript_24387/g.68392  ORF Transcript_24387/g.68392 Transcript_24387/m.68392 type:complete len:116 (+) Transcript_24387:114-461(+)
MSSIIPTELRDLRSCMICSLVKTAGQFLEDGCDNCPFLGLKDDRKAVADCTSSSFEGFLGMVENQKSWVARWQMLDAMKLEPAVYAISVRGEPPIEAIEACNASPNAPYINRDRS